MPSRRHLICAAGFAASGLASPVFAAPAPVEGKDYTLVRPTLDFPAKPVLVHDFFAYTCPHCLTFAPVMDRYVEEAKKDEGVRIVPVPVAWNEELEIFPRTYYAFEALGKLPELHMDFWQWVIKEPHDWKGSADIHPDIKKWVTARGIDLATWEKTVSSFSVMSKTRQAQRMWKNYGVDATPCVGIAGRYITAPHLVGTRQGTIDVIKTLVNKVRGE